MAETPLSSDMGDRANDACLALSVVSKASESKTPTAETMHHDDAWHEIRHAPPLRRDDDDDDPEAIGDGSKTAGRNSTADADTSGVSNTDIQIDTATGTAASSSIVETPPPQPIVNVTVTGTLPRTQSSPLLALDPMTMGMQAPVRRTSTHSGDTGRTPEDAETAHSRPALPSDTSSLESHESDRASSSVASVAPTPTPGGTAKASSYKVPRRDAPLRIFFPTEDLAMRAILSPPTLRNGAASTTTTTTTTNTNARTQSAAPLQQPADSKPSLAESFLETTSRLFFLRGGAPTATPSTATLSANAPAKETIDKLATPMRARRPSATSVALEDDLSKLHHTVVAASPNLPPPPFANMFACENCHDDIGSLLTQGRHHCRNCGGSFCATCSSKTTIVPFQLYQAKGEQRVCDGCFNRIREFHAQAQTTQLTWSGLPPPSSEILVREFDLPAHEVPVTIFNCSYFVDFAPFYGHLVLTRAHVCFRGYKSHKIKIAFAELHALIKPEFYYINALQLNTKHGHAKHFFAEFNGLRDLCFVRIDQLVRAFQDAKKNAVAQVPSAAVLKQQAIGRRRSYKFLAAAASGSGGDLQHTGSLDVDDEDEDDESELRSSVACSEDRDHEDEEAMSTGSSASDESAAPLAPDLPLSRMALLLDCELRADLQHVFDLLWGNDVGRAFLHDHMHKTNDIEIEIEDWQPITPANESATATGFVISKEDGYSLFRHVRSQHPPKTKFPGLPAYAGCCRLQRLRVEKDKTGTQWTRFVVSDLLRMSGIPFSDYFEIETRWVFTRDGTRYCHVQAGLIVNFIKSTWFKSQIESSTRSESKEGLEMWTTNALGFLQEHAGKPLAGPSPVAGDGSSSTSQSVESETSRRLSTVSIPSERASSGNGKISISPAEALPTPFMSPDLGRLWASSTPQSLIQLLTLVVLLYCVMVIRNQQLHLQRLTDTTALLLTKLNPSDPSATTTHSVCEQQIVDGAAAALQSFFLSQH